MEFSNPLFLILSLSGLIFLIAGYIMLKYPPKKINNLYGYRTRQSMESQEKWDVAQLYSSREIIKQGWYAISIAVVGLFLNPNNMLSMFLAVGIILFSIIVLFVKTEKELKKTSY